MPLVNRDGYVCAHAFHFSRACAFCHRSKTILDSCPYLSILALRWYPQQINGHKFEGKEGDYIRIPERLLDVPDAEITAEKSACELVQFTEYSSQQWFLTGNSLHALKNKVIFHLKNYVWNLIFPQQTHFSKCIRLLRSVVNATHGELTVKRPIFLNYF